MININEYIDRVCEEFNDYVSNSPKLCDINIDFSAGKIPDYNDTNVQQAYLLRYAYGYAFEYKVMYNVLFGNYEYSDNISVLSIGCGCMIDYWSLTRALRQKTWEDCIIDYIGIDSVGWEYCFESEITDNIRFIQGDAVAVLENVPSISRDVFFFPKSISEFSHDDLERIGNSIGAKNQNDLFHLLISVRANEYSMHLDTKRVKKLISAISSHGYVTSDDPDMYWRFTHDGTNDDKKIRNTDSEFKHPSKAYSLMNTLNTKCEFYISNGVNCNSECKDRLTRNVMVNVDAISYKILTFRRGVK